MGVYLFHAGSPQYRAVISKGYALDLSQNEILTEAAASYAPLAEALYIPDGVLAAIHMGAISMRHFCTKFKGADSISTHPRKEGAQFLHCSIPRDGWTA